MKKLMLILLVFTGSFAVVACNTVQGVGKDIQKSGEAIERVAR